MSVINPSGVVTLLRIVTLLSFSFVDIFHPSKNENSSIRFFFEYNNFSKKKLMLRTPINPLRIRIQLKKID